MDKPHLRHQIAALFMVVAVVTMTACTSTPPSRTDVSANRTIMSGVTGASLCGIATKGLGKEALPDEVLRTGELIDQGSVQSCTLTATNESKQLVKILVNYGVEQIATVESINKSLTDGSANSKQQCPGGSSLPKISAGLAAETTLICNKSDRSIFEYTGKSLTGTFTVRVERAINKGAISSKEAQQWVNVVALKVLAPQSSSTKVPAASTPTATTATSAIPICTWLLSELQTDNFSTSLSPSTFNGNIGIHDGSGVVETSCIVTPEIPDLGGPVGTEGAVWLTVTKESPLPSGTNYSHDGYSGVASDYTGNVYVNADGYQLTLNLTLDPTNQTIPAPNGNPQFVKDLMDYLLDKWSQGNRPTIPT